MMSMPPMSGVEHELDVDFGIEFELGPSNGAHPKIVIFMDLVLWKLSLIHI